MEIFAQYAKANGAGQGNLLLSNCKDHKENRHDLFEQNCQLEKAIAKSRINENK